MKNETIHVTDTRGEVDTHELRWDGGRQIKWVEKNGTERIPEETKTDYPYPGIFKAAGKVYTSLSALCKEKNESGYFCKDIYGRQVLYMSERFPCFDSYDYLYEDRYYRWFFIKEGGKLTRVYCADSRGTVQVTEDVRVLENKCLDLMKELKWLE